MSCGQRKFVDIMHGIFCFNDLHVCIVIIVIKIIQVFVLVQGFLKYVNDWHSLGLQSGLFHTVKDREGATWRH